MEIVAQGVLSGQLLHVWGIALLHVIERHGRGTLTRVEEGWPSQRFTVAAGAYRRFNPGKQVAQATAGIVGRCGRNVAIGLLPHLIETMNRTGSVVVVGDARRQLIDTLAQMQ